MFKRVLLTSILGTVMTIIGAVAEPTTEDLQTASSKAYVDTQVATKQLKIPAAGQSGVGAGETVMTYTANGNGEIGERGLYSDASSYNAATDGDKLITASALNATFTNLPTTDTTKLECANPGTCDLWTIVDQSAYACTMMVSPNLYKPEGKTEYTSNNVTISIDNQGLLHLNGTPSAATSIVLSAYNGSFTNGYTLSSHILSGTVTGSNSSIYPSSSVGYTPTIKFGNYGTSVRTETLGTIYITLRVGDSFNNAVIGIQILRGVLSSMPTYMPYGQICTDD